MRGYDSKTKLSNLSFGHLFCGLTLQELLQLIWNLSWSQVHWISAYPKKEKSPLIKDEYSGDWSLPRPFYVGFQWHRLFQLVRIQYHGGLVWYTVLSVCLFKTWMNLDTFSFEIRMNQDTILIKLQKFHSQSLFTLFDYSEFFEFENSVRFILTVRIF